MFRCFDVSSQCVDSVSRYTSNLSSGKLQFRSIMFTTKFILVVIIALSVAGVQAKSLSIEWLAQRDDLAEYLVDKTVFTRNKIDCVSAASEKHQAGQFYSDQGGTCRLLSCRLGWSGCRKCRNAANPSLPQLLVKRLNGLGLRNCWRTFQRRVDATVEFRRNWTEYRAGFGQGANGNFWMGLEAIHQLTRAADRRVRWEMSSWNGSWWWWENSVFIVDDSSQGYRVTVGSQDVDRSNVLECSQNAPQHINGTRFSTPDRDQDGSTFNCADDFQGGWWYKDCYCFNPNGRYFVPPTALSLPSNGVSYKGICFRGAGPASTSYPLDFTQSLRYFESLLIEVI